MSPLSGHRLRLVARYVGFRSPAMISQVGFELLHRARFLGFSEVLEQNTVNMTTYEGIGRSWHVAGALDPAPLNKLTAIDQRCSM